MNKPGFEQHEVKSQVNCLPLEHLQNPYFYERPSVSWLKITNNVTFGRTISCRWQITALPIAHCCSPPSNTHTHARFFSLSCFCFWRFFFWFFFRPAYRQTKSCVRLLSFAVTAHTVSPVVHSFLVVFQIAFSTRLKTFNIVSQTSLARIQLDWVSGELFLHELARFFLGPKFNCTCFGCCELNLESRSCVYFLSHWTKQGLIPVFNPSGAGKTKKKPDVDEQVEHNW